MKCVMERNCQSWQREMRLWKGQAITGCVERLDYFPAGTGGLREFSLYWGHESHEWPGWQLQMLHACNAAMQDPACLHRAQGTRGEKSQSQNVQALLFRASGFRACLQVTQPGRLSPCNCYTLRCLLTALYRPHDHSADRRLRNQYG